MVDEPKDLVLVRLEKVLAELSATRADVKAMREEMHSDMQQVKARITAVERQLVNQGESIAAQWENFDKHAERLYKLEHHDAP